MCSELFRIPLDWLNAPMFGGLSLGTVVAGLIALTIVVLLVRDQRRDRSAEAWGYVPGLLLLALALVIVPRVVPDGLPIRGYGVMVLLGLITAIAMATYRARQLHWDSELVISVTFAMIVCGIIGARLFYVIEYWDTRFQLPDWPSTLAAILKFTEGGLVVYGSLIGIIVAFVWFARRHRLPMLTLADLGAPSLMAALALGRIGCLLNGCCYGGESQLPWAITFPPESMLYQEQLAEGRTLGLHLQRGDAINPRAKVIAVDVNSPAARAGLAPGMRIRAINNAPVTDLAQAQQAILMAITGEENLRVETDEQQLIVIPSQPLSARSRPVQPTQVYSAINAALLAWVLWSFYPFRRRDGEVFALMLTLYPISRFLLEIIRVDEAAVFGTGLSISQNISVILLILAAALWFYLSRQPYRLANLATAAASHQQHSRRRAAHPGL